MSIVTIGDFKNYLQTVANAVSSGKMNVNDAEVKSVLQTIAAAVGEVSATPTANTLADRLKAIADRLGEASANPTANTALARLKALEGYLDGVEAALGTQSDAEATGNGSIIAILKRLRAILSDVWNDTANALNVQLTGSNVPDTQPLPTKRTGVIVEEIAILNAVAVTDTGVYFTSPIELSKYKSIRLIARSTLDQEVTITVQLRNGLQSTKFWDAASSSWKDGVSDDALKVKIPGNDQKYYDLSSKWTFLTQNNVPIKSIVMSYKATVAPTTGSLSIWAWGVPN